MTNWQKLSLTALVAIYGYLPRKDRLACAMVCSQWKRAMDQVELWDYMVVNIDDDLMDPSTMICTRYFSKYIKSLEIGWAHPERMGSWLPLKHRALTKRTVRWLSVLIESNVQLNYIKIFDWYDVFKCKKIIYHLNRFLVQDNLSNITFNNLNMYRDDCIKLFISSLSKGSNETINYISLHNTSCYQLAYDSQQFQSLVQGLSNLKVIELDYFILSRSVIRALIGRHNKNLRYLHVGIRDASGSPILEEDWRKLSHSCPQLTVGFTITNVVHYDAVCNFLKPNIPLSSFSMYTGMGDQSKRHFRRSIHLLVKHYHETLENINLQLRNHSEILDDDILNLVKSCPKLTGVNFGGVITNMNTVRDICQLKENKNTKYVHVKLKKRDDDERTQVTDEYFKKGIDFKIVNHEIGNVVYIYH
ncbi:F-box only protein 39 isoform X2 [Aethina tumida]|uniref:F-box only protein 39 isoform X2 n=1 Tax=Aethina tumida TaxID=116153 RepID=UPI00214992C8|nr:F-box only protein 39 isoform X2 [Aethina tumida]